jgi:hypothetical protein
MHSARMRSTSAHSSMREWNVEVMYVRRAERVVEEVVSVRRVLSWECRVWFARRLRLRFVEVVERAMRVWRDKSGVVRWWIGMRCWEG